MGSAAAMSRRGSADAKEGSAKNHKRTGSKELQTENSFERTYSLSVEDPTAGNIFKRSYSALSANTTPTLATDEIDEEIPPVKLVPPVRVVMPREEPLSRPNSESILMDSGTVAARRTANKRYYSGTGLMEMQEQAVSILWRWVRSQQERMNRSSTSEWFDHDMALERTGSTSLYMEWLPLLSCCS